MNGVRDYSVSAPGARRADAPLPSEALVRTGGPLSVGGCRDSNRPGPSACSLAQALYHPRVLTPPEVRREMGLRSHLVAGIPRFWGGASGIACWWTHDDDGSSKPSGERE